MPPLPTLGSLGIRMPAGLKSVEEVTPEWEEMEMAVDSGASESVVSEDMLQGVETVEGYAKKKGIQYEVADGTLIPNLGEKKFVAVSDAGGGPSDEVPGLRGKQGPPERAQMCASRKQSRLRRVRVVHPRRDQRRNHAPD